MCKISLGFKLSFDKLAYTTNKSMTQKGGFIDLAYDFL